MTAIIAEPRHALPQPSAIARKFRPDIQGMRAIAAGLVVFYHAGVPGIRGGYVGVDVFFVISGFLITRALFDELGKRGRISFTGFYARRARRLLPPVVLVVACSLALARFVLPYDQLKSFIKDTFYASFYGLNYHFAQEGVQYQNASAPPSPLQHFWSLAVEEQFYVVWPALIALCAVVGRRRLRRPLTIAVISALSAYTLYLSVTLTATDTSLAYFSLQTRAWELGAGALVALTIDQWARIPAAYARLLAWASLIAIVAAAFAYDDRTPYPGSAALVPVVAAAVLIGAGAIRHDRTPETAFLQSAPMQYVGKTSYAWYLWHWPLLILLPAWVGRDLNLGENIEVVLLALWFATLTYFVENAAHRSTWTMRRWALAGTGLSACVALLALVSNQIVPNLATSGKAQVAYSLNQADINEVQRALNQSLSIRALPSNLTPSLTDAAEDHPRTPTQTSGVDHNRYAECLASLADVMPRMCVFGDASAKRTAVLVGDSHAYQWMSPLAAQAEKAHWKLVLVAKSACPIAHVSIWENDLKRFYTECNVFREKAIPLIRSLKPSLIIASQSNAVPWKSVSDSDWAQKSVDALTALGSANTRYVYLGDTPTTGVNGLQCLQQHIENATKCIYQRQDAFGPFFDRYRVLQRSLEASGVGFVDTLPFYCNQYVCPRVVQNMVVFRDDGHMTDTYAKWLTPMLANVFPKGTVK